MLDIDPQLVVDVCSTGAGGSWALTNLGPKIVQDDFAPGFKIKDMLKDLRLVTESIATDNGYFQGTALAANKFLQSEQLGGGDQGTQAMIRAYRHK